MVRVPSCRDWVEGEQSAMQPWSITGGLDCYLLTNDYAPCLVWQPGAAGASQTVSLPPVGVGSMDTAWSLHALPTSSRITTPQNWTEKWMSQRTRRTSTQWPTPLKRPAARRIVHA